MANNPKGRAELQGFRELGFSLVYNGNDIERGIALYESSEIDGKRVLEYGLEESRYDLWRGHTKVAGKMLLMIHRAALREVFDDASICSYQDLWKVGGAVEKGARRASSTSRKLAVHHFRTSLNIRTGQAKSGHADLGHQQMGDEMQECIGRIERMDNKPTQAPKRQKTETKGVGASINAFALLGEDEEEDHDGNGVRDEDGDLSMAGVSLL